MTARVAIVAACVVAVLAGCAGDFSTPGTRVQARSNDGRPLTAPMSPLAGTSWRLVRFQSSDDAIGSVVPPNVDRYTVAFGADGALSLRLDCNHGTGRWEATSPVSAAAGGERTGGGLSILPGPMTRAWCGERALDSRLMRDLADVRSFTIAGGLLSLALKADAGVYLWEPVAR